MKKSIKWIILGVAVIGVGIFIFPYVTSKKLVCESEAGNITIMYDSNKLVAFTSSGKIGFDLQTQNSYAKKISTKTYIDKFSTWFTESTKGTCTIK